MIPQIGLTELLIVGAIALIVVGPKDLPLMMRKLGRMVGQAKNLAREFQSSFDELGRQAELDELKKEVESLKKDPTGINEEMSRTNREIGEAARGTSKPAGASHAASGQQNVRTAPQSQPAEAGGGPGIEAPPGAPDQSGEGAPARPAGPRIEPVAQARPKPGPQSSAEPAETAPAED